MKPKMNTYPQLTLADGAFILDGSDVQGIHTPRKIYDTDVLRVELTLDILNACDFNCPGCFVQRKNPQNSNDLKMMVQLTDVFKEMSVNCEEIFIGPTDIFSASNFYEVISDPHLATLAQTYSLGTSTTLLTDTDEVVKRLEQIDLLFVDIPARDMLFTVIIDVERYLKKDWFYLNQLENNLRLLKEDTVFFVVNYTAPDMFSKHNTTMEQLAIQLMEDYNVPLRVIPSFFRSGKKSTVEPRSRGFAKMIIDEMGGKLSDHLQINMLNKQFNGNGFLNYSFRGHELYTTPYLYDGIPQTAPLFHVKRNVDGVYTKTILSETQATIMSTQYKYAIETECGSCEHLASCVSRSVLLYMQSRDIKVCILPKSMIHEPN